jgi:hypothetical protein
MQLRYCLEISSRQKKNLCVTTACLKRDYKARGDQKIPTKLILQYLN